MYRDTNLKEMSIKVINSQYCLRFYPLTKLSNRKIVKMKENVLVLIFVLHKSNQSKNIINKIKLDFTKVYKMFLYLVSNMVLLKKTWVT